MNSLSNDGSNFRAPNPNYKPRPLARSFAEMVVAVSPFETLRAGGVVGNGNNGDFRALPDINPYGHAYAPQGETPHIPLRQERSVLFMRPLDN